MEGQAEGKNFAMGVNETAPSWSTVLWQRGLCNSVKLWAMPCRATQDGQVIVESSTGGGDGKPLQYTCHESIVNRNSNNLRCVDDTLMAESEEELKSLFMRLKQESERAGLKLNIKKKLR